MNRIDLKKPAGYEEDFALWSLEQATLLRAGKLDRVDLENVAEQIEGLARRNRHEIASRLVVLLAHLLKYRFQPSERTNSWRATILGQRIAINELIDESPSLRDVPITVLQSRFPVAGLQASGETGLPEADFPETCPWSVEQVLDPDFLPD